MKNPATWSHEQTVEWITQAYRGKIDPSVLCPFESGLQLWYFKFNLTILIIYIVIYAILYLLYWFSRVPEAEYMRRIMLDPKITEKQAKRFYMMLWEMVVDARTRKRQEAKVFKIKYIN